MNDEENKRREDEAIDAMEANRIIAIIENQVRRAECGSIVQICKSELLEPESYERMWGDFIYGIISNEEDTCPSTGSVAYQVNWAYAHLPFGNSFLSFVAPVWEHDFSVVKFPEDEDENDDIELTRQFSKHNGEWMIVEYGGHTCEFCEGHSCDRAQYSDELEHMYDEVAQMEVPHNQKRYTMYRQFTTVKYGSLGNGNRRKLDDCVQELIVPYFPLVAGKRKRGYKSAKNNKEEK